MIIRKMLFVGIILTGQLSIACGPSFFKVYDSTPFFPKTSHFPKTPESLVILCKVLIIKKMLEHKESKKSIVGA